MLQFFSCWWLQFNLNFWQKSANSVRVWVWGRKARWVASWGCFPSRRMEHDAKKGTVDRPCLGRPAPWWIRFPSVWPSVSSQLKWFLRICLNCDLQSKVLKLNPIWEVREIHTFKKSIEVAWLFKRNVPDTYQIRSEGAGGKLTLRVPLMLCNCNCNVIFVLVIFFLTHSLWANLATVSDLRIPSTKRALKPGKGGNSPGVLGVDPDPPFASSIDCTSGKTSSSSFNKEDPDKVLDRLLRYLLWFCIQELFNTSAESSSSLSSTAAWRLKIK